MQKNLFLIVLASFILFATTVSATSPFSMSLTTNTLYQNTNTTPLSIYSITHSAPLSAYLGTSSSNMLEVTYEDGGSVTISSIVYSLAGYNMSSYMLVQPNEYYKFNFTSANFIGQYQPSSNSNVISGGSSQPVGFLSFYPQLETDGMLGILIYGVCILLFTLRLVKLREQNWTWVIILFASGAFCWFGFYFSVFPFQNLTSTTTVVNATTGNAIYTYAQTAQYPVTTPNSYEFLALITFTFFWTFITFLFGIAEALEIMRNGATDSLPEAK